MASQCENFGDLLLLAFLDSKDFFMNKTGINTTSREVDTSKDGHFGQNDGNTTKDRKKAYTISWNLSNFTQLHGQCVFLQATQGDFLRFLSSDDLVYDLISTTDKWCIPKHPHVDFTGEKCVRFDKCIALNSIGDFYFMCSLYPCMRLHVKVLEDRCSNEDTVCNDDVLDGVYTSYHKECFPEELKCKKKEKECRRTMYKKECEKGDEVGEKDDSCSEHMSERNDEYKEKDEERKERHCTEKIE